MMIKNLYDEARQCIAANAFTASILSCRKILMHVAVSKGAKENLNFIEYVDYLAKNNYLAQGGKDWVDLIRQKGNEANHEIKIMSENDAKDLIKFTEMLLKIIYEFPADVLKRKNT